MVLIKVGRHTRLNNNPVPYHLTMVEASWRKGNDYTQGKGEPHYPMPAIRLDVVHYYYEISIYAGCDLLRRWN